MGPPTLAVVKSQNSQHNYYYAGYCCACLFDGLEHGVQHAGTSGHQSKNLNYSKSTCQTTGAPQTPDTGQTPCACEKEKVRSEKLGGGTQKESDQEETKARFEKAAEIFQEQTGCEKNQAEKAHAQTRCQKEAVQEKSCQKNQHQHAAWAVEQCYWPSQKR